MKNDGMLGFLKKDAGTELMMPLLVVGVLALMILPLPPLILDILIAINITISLLMLLTALQVKNSLEFSVFPSLLLMTTLFRLSLNVASTRLILLDGSSGTEAAGEIIKTFGVFIVGGSYVVGIVVFLILTLINFIVITKGSGRIAEVTARFTLDALPGKQMSIDSDLASGLVTQDEARERRETLALETEFYGAMDGSSKFVRGDAIAGLIITAINIIGGLCIGVLQADMTFGDAAEAYTVLTIGDALVSQVPALFISTAAGMVITRVADSRGLGKQVAGQLMTNPRTLIPGAAILGALALVPNMPLMPFVLLIAGLMYLAWKGPDDEDDEEKSLANKPELTEEEQIERMLPVETLELEVGYALVQLVDARKDGEVIKRIGGLRKNFARDLGVILPPVHVRDNLELKPGEYRLLIHGVELARGSLMSDRLLAMDPGDSKEDIDGIATTEPAFGLPALWIRTSQKTRAEIAGYTVVEPATVIVTHISEALRRHTFELVGREELQQLLEIVARRSPKAVDELIPNVISHAELLALVRAILKEGVSIRDMRTILEVITEAAVQSKAIPWLVDRVRERLGAAIVQDMLDSKDVLHAAMFDAQSEETMRASVVRTELDTTLALDLNNAQNLVLQLRRTLETHQRAGVEPVAVLPADLRYPVQQFAIRFCPGVNILSQREIPSRVEVNTDLSLSLFPTDGASAPAEPIASQAS
jgi:flagellar biosynthesis protein FlhA